LDVKGYGIDNFYVISFNLILSDLKRNNFRKDSFCTTFICTNKKLAFWKPKMVQWYNTEYKKWYIIGTFFLYQIFYKGFFGAFFLNFNFLLVQLEVAQKECSHKNYYQYKE
jgi:hypothetical protein